MVSRQAKSQSPEGRGGLSAHRKLGITGLFPSQFQTEKHKHGENIFVLQNKCKMQIWLYFLNSGNHSKIHQLAENRFASLSKFYIHLTIMLFVHFRLSQSRLLACPKVGCWLTSNLTLLQMQNENDERKREVWPWFWRNSIKQISLFNLANVVYGVIYAGKNLRQNRLHWFIKCFKKWYLLATTWK